VSTRFELASELRDDVKPTSYSRLSQSLGECALDDVCRGQAFRCG
jgi:hypothetical protein